MAAAELKAVATSGDLVAIARRLGQEFAKHAAETDETDTFVADNYEALKASGLVEAGVPKELGGGGHSVDELAAMLKSYATAAGFGKEQVNNGRSGAQANA